MSGRISYKTILAILSLIFLLASIPLGVFLIKQRQEIRKKAAGFEKEAILTPAPSP